MGHVFRAMLWKASAPVIELVRPGSALRTAIKIHRAVKADPTAFVPKSPDELCELIRHGRVRVGRDKEGSITSFSVLTDLPDCEFPVLGPVGALVRDHGWGADHASVAVTIGYALGAMPIVFTFADNIETTARLEHMRWVYRPLPWLPASVKARADDIASGRRYVAMQATDEAWRYAAERLKRKRDKRELIIRDPFFKPQVWTEIELATGQRLEA